MENGSIKADWRGWSHVAALHQSHNYIVATTMTKRGKRETGEKKDHLNRARTNSLERRRVRQILNTKKD